MQHCCAERTLSHPNPRERFGKFRSTSINLATCVRRLRPLPPGASRRSGKLSETPAPRKFCATGGCSGGGLRPRRRSGRRHERENACRGITRASGHRECLPARSRARRAHTRRLWRRIEPAGAVGGGARLGARVRPAGRSRAVVQQTARTVEEGAIAEMVIGFKGTMSALFLKGLAPQFGTTLVADDGVSE